MDPWLPIALAVRDSLPCWLKAYASACHRTGAPSTMWAEVEMQQHQIMLFSGQNSFKAAEDIRYALAAILQTLGKCTGLPMGGKAEECSREACSWAEDGAPSPGTASWSWWPALPDQHYTLQGDACQLFCELSEPFDLWQSI